MEYLDDDGKKSVESFTSLSLLVGRLGEEYSSDDVIVVVSDTLAVNHNVYGILDSYDETIDSIKKKVREYMCGLEADIHVLPGTISKIDGRVVGKPRDFYYMMLYTMTNLLKKHPRKRVLLDTTHGVNYMPTLAYQAVKEALSLVGPPTGNDDARLEVYNSDPVSFNKEQGIACSRNKNNPCSPNDLDHCKQSLYKGTVQNILKEAINYASLIPYLENILSSSSIDKILSPLGQPDVALKYRKNSFHKEAEEALRQAKIIIKLLRYGLAPQLAYYTATRGEETLQILQETINAAISLWKDEIIVSSEKNEIRRRLGFGEGFRILIYAHTLLERVINILNNDQEKYSPPTISSIQYIANTIYNGVSLFKAIHRREITKLRNKLKEFYPLNLRNIRLGTLYCMSSNPKESCDRFSRDLIAHGGWHTDIIYIDCPESSDPGNCKITIGSGEVCQYSRDESTNIWSFIEKQL